MADLRSFRCLPDRLPRLVMVAALLAVTPAAHAHHRQTPPIVALTTSGDNRLPRTTSPGRKTVALALQDGADRRIVAVDPFRNASDRHPIYQQGQNDDPSISFNAKSFAWETAADPLDSGAPGTQVVLSRDGVLSQVAIDPTGTSTNAAVDSLGVRVAFESTGDLAGTGNPGALQVFLRNADGSLQQVSKGIGTSKNGVVSAKGRIIAFESSSDPDTGTDTGIAQIWTASLFGGLSAPITHGAGPSSDPAVSDDGRIIVFQSTAALATDGADTGTPQIFAYDTRSATYAQVTADDGGCTSPSVARVKRDWRITFICSGEAQFYMLGADQRFRVQTSAPTTSRILPQLGAHFVMLSTTANLSDDVGTTQGEQIYMVNLFRRPPELIPGVALWFPSRGIPSL